MSFLRHFSRATSIVVTLIAVVATTASFISAQNPQKFRSEFEAAFKSQDYEAKKRVVSGDRIAAQIVLFSIYEPEYCRAIIDANDAKTKELGELMDDLAQSYKIEFKDKLLENRKKWVDGLQGSDKKTRLENSTKYSEAWTAGDKARRSGEAEEWKTAMTELEACASACLGIKDYYFAAGCFDLIFAGHKSLQDQFAMAYSARRMIDLAIKPGGLDREFTGYSEELDSLAKKDIKKPDLIDITLSLEESRKKYEKDYAESLIIKPASVPKGDKNSKGGAQPAMLVPPTSPDGEDWLEETGFKPSAPIDVTQRMTPFVVPWRSEAPQPELFLQGFEYKRGEKPENFMGIPGAKASFDKKFQVDLDGDPKTPDIELKLKPKPEIVSFTLKYDDGSTAKLSYVMQLMGTKINIFGKEAPYAEPEKFYRFMAVGASTVSGKCRGHNLTFIDTNGNGTFDDEADTVIIDAGTKNERIEPKGRFIYLDQGGGLYPYEIKIVLKNASTIRTRPYKGELVPLSVEYKSKVAPKFLVAHGSGENSQFLFNCLLAREKPIWVPPGNYSVSHGYMTTGADLKKENFAIITKGRALAQSVESGKQTIWSLGGAGEKGYWMTTKITRAADDPNAIEISGKDLRVYGNFGEEYHNFYPTRIVPSVEIRKNDGNGAIVAKKEMAIPGGDNIQIVDLWFAAKLQVKGVAKTEKVVVKLRAEHPLLGKIESEWLPVSDN